jgi:hypothetical protein
VERSELRKIASSGFTVKQDSEIAPGRRPSRSLSSSSGRGAKEFFIKKYSDLCELGRLCGKYLFTENPE